VRAPLRFINGIEFHNATGIIGDALHAFITQSFRPTYKLENRI